MTGAHATLVALLEPALRDAISALAAPRPGEGGLAGVAASLAAAAEAAQHALGEEARDPRIHRIVGSAASAAMALSLGEGLVPLAEVRGRLQEGLDLLTAGSWPPEDQDPAV